MRWLAPLLAQHSSSGRWLVERRLGGHEKAYKRFLPTRQVQSRVWYSAYPYLTTKNIANNAAIREGLSGDSSDDDTKAWLMRFGVGNRLPESGFVARILDGIPWDRLCRCSR